MTLPVQQAVARLAQDLHASPYQVHHAAGRELEAVAQSASPDVQKYTTKALLRCFDGMAPSMSR